MLLAAGCQRGNQQFAALEDAFHLEAHEFVFALAERPRRLQPLRLDQRMNGRSQGSIGHADEAPWLHQADAGCEVRGGDQAAHQGIVERIAQEMTHVAPGAHHPVNDVDFLWGEVRHSDYPVRADWPRERSHHCMLSKCTQNLYRSRCAMLDIAAVLTVTPIAGRLNLRSGVRRPRGRWVKREAGE